MGNLEDEFLKGELAAPNRVLNRELFLFLLDHEVKRARRYQNFICLLLLRLQPSSKNNNDTDFQDCHRMVSNLLMEEMRESDIIGYFGKNQLVVLLPYADILAGDHAKCRFEAVLKCFDIESKGYELLVEKICFPKNGTDPVQLVREALEKKLF
jgi:GGDEF domain-containing protein